MRRTTLKRYTPMRRTGIARSAPKRVKRTVQEVVLERDSHRCVRCGVHLAGRFYSVHHRKLRRHGDHTSANLITLCGSGTTGCHGWVHDNPDLARDPELGYLVRSRTEPGTVPVLVHGLGLAYPVDDGWELAA